MRYSIMLQLATGITTILVATAAMFAWIQSRSSPNESKVPNSEYFTTDIYLHSGNSRLDITNLDCLSRSHYTPS